MNGAEMSQHPPPEHAHEWGARLSTENERRANERTEARGENTSNLPQNAAQDATGGEKQAELHRSNFEAAVRAEATVTPSREDLIQAISEAESRTDDDGSWALPEDVADEILALFPGRSGAEVKAEALREAAADMPNVSWGDFWDEGKQKCGAHIKEVVDPHSKPFPTIRSVGVKDWLHARADLVERGGE